MIMVLVMDRKLAQFFAAEFPAAPRAEVGIQSERLLAILLLTKFPAAPHISNESIAAVGGGRWFFQ
jgi:hypothetical protein